MQHNLHNDLPFIIIVSLLVLAFIISLSYQNLKDINWFKKKENEEEDLSHPHKKEEDKV